MAVPLLSVSNLCIVSKHGDYIVRNLSLDVCAGQTAALVGQSGSGKSMTALAILGLIPTRLAKASGSVLFDGQSLMTLERRAMEQLRGHSLSMIFQDPLSALNPVFCVGEQIAEVGRTHLRMSREQSTRMAIELLDRVSLPSPSRVYASYPHELSGGMRQRVMIAMAVACKPKLLIADEPTTALDPTIQRDILDLLRSLQQETGMSILIITHDLSLVEHFAQQTYVLRQGQLVTEGHTSELFLAPQDDYLAELLTSVPRLRRQRVKRTGAR